MPKRIKYRKILIQEKSKEKYIMATQLITGTGCDLGIEFLEENNIIWIPITVIEGEKEYKDRIDIDAKTLFEKQREGIIFKTSQPSLKSQEESFKKCIEEGKDIVYIALSSGITGEWSAASMAIENLDKKGVRYKIVDTKSASVGNALFVLYLNEAIKNGMPFEKVCEFADFLTENVRAMASVFDMTHLYNGGRVSKVSFTVGKLLNMKPIIHFERSGALVPKTVVKGNKATIKKMIEIMKEEKGGIFTKDERIITGHGSTLEDVEVFEKALRKEEDSLEIIRRDIGCGIGAHTGESVMAVGYITKPIPEEFEKYLNK